MRRGQTIGRRLLATGVVVAVVAGIAACGSPRIGTGGPEGGQPGGGPPGGGRHLPAAARGAVAPLSADGRWLTDTTGRVVLLHGVNEVVKHPPYHPSADGFGADDAELLAGHGFTAVRLGVDLRGLMPAMGQIDRGYVEDLAVTVGQLAEQHIFVLLDFHQDGFAPRYNGNGFPDWMAIDDGLPNPPDAVFPLYYIQNPAMQRAFESFWANRPAPDGVGLQDHFIAGLTAVVERFAGQPYVIGYELMNEPWPGADWQPCVLGPVAACAALEQSRLAPFYARATAAVRRITSTQAVYVEPFVLFNFGQVATSLPGAGSGNGLSFHSYALDAAGEQQVIANAVVAAERDRVPLIETEFGATDDGPTVDRLAGQADAALLSWMFWAYNENLQDRIAGEPTPLLEALVRPYPLAVTGTPIVSRFDPASRTYELRYGTAGPGGRSYPRALPTVISVPDLHYGDGYLVRVSGARVTSRPCAERLTLRTLPHADQVTVHLAPGECPDH
jgi:endoglycosylceramidase